MALKGYQKTLLPNTLYAVAASGGSEQLQPSIEVIGTATIYGSETFPASPPAGMSTTTAMTGFTGIDYFAVIPNYMYIAGSPASIVVSGVTAIQSPTS